MTPPNDKLPPMSHSESTTYRELYERMKDERDALKTVAFHAQEMAKEIAGKLTAKEAEVNELLPIKAERDALRAQLAAAQAELKNERLWKEHYKESAQALAGETIRLGELLKVAEDALAEIVATISRRKWIDQDGTALDTAEETLSRLRAGATVKDEEC